MVGGGRRSGDMNDLSLRGGTKLTLKISDVSLKERLRASEFRLKFPKFLMYSLTENTQDLTKQRTDSKLLLS